MGNKIKCNNYVYKDDSILSGNCFIGNSLAGEELSIDTLDFMADLAAFTVTTSDGNVLKTRDGKLLMCRSDASEYKFGDIARYFHNDSLIGKFYLEKPPVRTGRTKYDFPCISAMGLLDKRKHYGGMYEETPARDIIADLMGDIPYMIYPEVAAELINNWLPVATCRENLHQVLFAIGAGIFKDSNGDIVIKFVESSGPVLIDDDRIYINGQVDYKAPATRVDVTEYAYHALAGDETVTLFDTSEAVTSQVVLFNQPCHDLIPDGLTIEESGVNYAIVSGTGTLQGQTYTDTQRIISHYTGIEGAENIVTVTDATLVSAYNSYNVALRVAQYYSEVSTINIGLVVCDERPATEISFTNPFDESETGYIRSMDINMSATLKADTEIAKGFLPVGQGNNYNNYVLLTGTGKWTVPEGVTRIRVIACESGSPGNPGQNGQTGSTSSGGAGGNPGEGGDGGKILEIDLSVTPLTVKNYSCDSHTVFDGISAETGRVRASGYTDPKSGLTLGRKGVSGELAGGAGSGTSGAGPAVTKNGLTYQPGANGSPYTAYGVTADGGFGGGAGSAGNGNPGQNGSVIQTGGYTQGDEVLIASGYMSDISPYYGYTWYYFSSSTGVFTNSGTYGALTVSNTSVYNASGSTVTRTVYQVGTSPSEYRRYQRTATGGPVTERRNGGGGQGGLGAPGTDATDYGRGGQGGDGGGGGGQSRGYTNGNPGPGGPGGPGGSGGPGAILVLY